VDGTAQNSCQKHAGAREQMEKRPLFSYATGEEARGKGVTTCKRGAGGGLKSYGRSNRRSGDVLLPGRFSSGGLARLGEKGNCIEGRKNSAEGKEKVKVKSVEKKKNS